MRKLLLSVFVGIVAICIVGHFTVSKAAEKDKNVTVVDMKGAVQIMTTGSSNWMPASAFMKLGNGDTVRTMKDSYADLNFNGMGQSALVRVEADSSLKIDSYIASTNVAERKIALDLAVGDILVKANKMQSESQFQIKTPSSVVGVRGTGFKVHVSSSSEK